MNSSEIRENEIIKVHELAHFLKEHADAQVVVSGYADVQTGNPPYNKALSLRRAREVAKALIAAGITEDRISIIAKGDTEQPFSVAEQNRVAVCVAE